MTAKTWLDIMPAVPLVRAVPVVAGADDPRRAVVVDPYHDLPAEWCTVARPGNLILEWRADGSVRVDLEDPQGFGYALRHLATFGRWHSMGLDPIAWRHWLGDTNATDRRAVAHLLAEVTA